MARVVRVLSLIAAMAMLAAVAHAQSYPVRPVRIVYPYPPGPGDFVARSFTKYLSESLGQQFIVDNRAGANGNVGSEIVARAAPDGYTLLITASSNLTINPSLYRQMPFDVQRDFTPVSVIAASPNILVVHPSLPVNSVKQLAALAKARPGQITFGSAGVGSSGHLAGELFNMVAGVDMLHVPYKGAGPATTDLVGGQIQMIFNNMPAALPLVKTGKLRALAVTGRSRASAAPELPTMAEAGFPGVVMTLWNGMLAPAGTPRDIIDKLHAEIVKAANRPELRTLLSNAGTEAFTTTPQEMADTIKAETALWAKVVTAAKIPPAQ